MDKKVAARLLKKVDKISAMLMEVKSLVQDELGATTRSLEGRKETRKPNLHLPAEQLVAEYELLVDAFTREGRKAVEQYVQTHSVSYLDKFIQENGLPIPT